MVSTGEVEGLPVVAAEADIARYIHLRAIGHTGLTT
jgi:hypothetical protein